MEREIYLISAIVLTGCAFTGWYISLKVKELKNSSADEEKTKNIVNQVFGEITQKVIEQTKGVLEGDKEAIYKDNTNKKEIIENLVKELRKEIEERQIEIRELEKDRNKKFGDIQRSIEEHRLITQELKTSTESLSRVLSNNQQRGEWGERIIEDILTNAGLVENIHYQKQAKLGTSDVKPDITLLLPNQRKVAIDVKFPYSEIQKMTHAQTKEAKSAHLKVFSQDVRTKIKQIEKYVDIENGTLDYAIMFVPNEMLFSFINQQMPSVVDEAMTKKIMIVSPFTFLIVARTVMESYKNFMVENNLRKIIKHIQEFATDWERFEGEFGKLDETISKLRENYDQIHDTRFKRMQLRLKRINDYQQIQGKKDE